MSKIIAPFLFMLVTVGLFFTYIKPAFEALQAFRALDTKVNEVLSKSKAVNSTYNSILEKTLLISKSDMQRLNQLLPEDFDTLRYFLQLDALAFKYGIEVRSFTIPLDNEKNAEADVGNENGGDKNIIPVTYSLDCEGSYVDIVPFLDAIEKNLALSDVTSFILKVQESDATEKNEKKTIVSSGQKTYLFTININTYKFIK